MLHTVADLFEQFFGGSKHGTFLAEEVNALLEDLPSDVVGRILILHELVLE